MSTSYYGSTISLISKSDIRYEGILYSIDTNDSTIALAKARSFGTENRPVENPIGPRDEVYEYIIFRATDIKDLIVQDPPGSTSQPSSSAKTLIDPAIIQVQSMPGASSISKSFPGPLASLGNSTNDSVNNPTVSSSTNRTISNLTSMGLNNINQSNQGSQSSLTSGPPATGPAFGSTVDFRSGRSTPTPGLRRSPVSDAGVQMPSPAQNHRDEKNQSSQVINREGRMQNYSNYRSGNDRRMGGQPGGPHANYQRRPMGHPNQAPVRHMPQPLPPFNHNFRGGRVGPPMGAGSGGMLAGGSKRGPMVNRAAPQPRVYQNTRPQPTRNPSYNRTAMNRNIKEKTSLKITDDYDFEKANKEFEELENKFSKVKVEENSESEDSKSKENQNESSENENEKKENDEENVFYDKSKSFFDKISCEAIERSKGKVNRVDWRKERKINAETFGLNLNNFRRGGYRGRGGYLSGFTGYSRQNRRRNEPEGGVWS